MLGCTVHFRERREGGERAGGDLSNCIVHE
jgi:hypothetical protein